MLRLTDVTKSYGTLVAVDDLSFEVRRGEIFGLLGPNGAGKTTTVSLAVGLLAPDRGTIAIGDRGSPTSRDVRRHIGVAPQALALYEDLSGDENLSFFGRLQGLHGQALRDRVDRSLDFVGLTDRRHSRVATWSGGMKRRLNLAVALVHDPPLLLLDEPTVGVDPQSRNAILERILALRADGRAIIYTTHYMEEAEKLCDRVAIVDHGRLLALDTVGGLIASHGGPSRLVVETDDGTETVEAADPLAELRRRLETGPLRAFRVEEPDLERVFLNLTGHLLRD